MRKTSLILLLLVVSIFTIAIVAESYNVNAQNNMITVNAKTNQMKVEGGSYYYNYICNTVTIYIGTKWISTSNNWLNIVNSHSNSTVGSYLTDVIKLDANSHQTGNETFNYASGSNKASNGIMIMYIYYTYSIISNGKCINLQNSSVQNYYLEVHSNGYKMNYSYTYPQNGLILSGTFYGYFG